MPVHPSIYHHVCAVQCHTQPSVSWPTDTAVTCLLYLQHCGLPTPKLALLRRKSSPGITALGNSTSSRFHTHTHTLSLSALTHAHPASQPDARAQKRKGARPKQIAMQIDGDGPLPFHRSSLIARRRTSRGRLVYSCVRRGHLLLLLTCYLRPPHTACCCVVHLRCSCMAWLLRLRTMPGQPATHRASRPNWPPSDSLTASLLT